MKISKKLLKEKYASEELLTWFKKEFDDEKVGHKKVLDRMSRQGCSNKESEYLIHEAVWLLRSINNIEEDIRLDVVNARRTIFIAGNLKCNSICSDHSLYVTGNIDCDGDLQVKGIRCGGNIKVSGKIETKYDIYCYGKIKSKKLTISHSDSEVYCKKIKVKKKSKFRKHKKAVNYFNK